MSKTYLSGQRPALRNVSLSVRPQELVAVLGPSGCGKTTLLRLVAGFEVPDGGEAWLAGRQVAGPGVWVPPERRGVGMVFQDYALFPHLDVAGNVGFGLAHLPRAERRRRVDEMLALVGLRELAHRYPHELSGGQQQRTALARALAPEPLVVLLDEPFSSLDADLRVQMREELRRVLVAACATAVFVTHDQEEAFTLAHRIAVLNAGSLEQVGTPEEVYYRPATRFVAGFVGRADVLEGTIQDGAVLTPLGPLPLPPGSDLARGPAEVVIRPDAWSVSPAGSAPPASGQLDPEGGRALRVGGATAVVIRRTFLGPVALHALRLSTGERIHATSPAEVRLEPGSSVRVALGPGRYAVFPKGS